MYVAAGGSPAYALWGELMSTAARARGAAGAVLGGYTRDTHGILAMGFPVFCYGSYAQDQRGRGRVVDFRSTLNIGNVTIRPGDIVFGDIDGVVVLPCEVETEVVQGALEQVRKEKTAKRLLCEGALAESVFIGNWSAIALKLRRIIRAARIQISSAHFWLNCQPHLSFPAW